MGGIASEYADFVIVTDDNPRNEDPEEIRSQIINSCNDAIEISDRAEAIKKGIDTGKKGDSIIIAGKGHEKYQIIGQDTVPFSDQETVRNILGK
jgi:UDP-N-acetylmuramoyl-L-alanyl-D-glutamate--2,6-diaminopimelate ligase